MIHLTTSRNAQVSGAAWKTVQFVSCGCEFLYRLEREAKATKTTIAPLDDENLAETAWYKALALLALRLNTECDPVPCPDCGIYQPDMVAMLKKRRSRVPHTAGIGAIVVWTLPVTLAALSDRWHPFRPVLQMLAPPFGYLLIGGLCGIGLGIVLRILYDPNKNAAQRAGNVPAGPNGPIRKAEFAPADDQLEVW